MEKETEPRKGEPACLVVPGEMKVRREEVKRKGSIQNAGSHAVWSLRLALHCTAQSRKHTLSWIPGMEVVNHSPSLALCTMRTVFA